MRFLSNILNPFYTVAFFVLTVLSTHAQTVRISEIVAYNNNSLTDEDGASSDWIELYNTTNTAVDLTGWHLSDDATDLSQWTFPSTSIPANSFIVVFASNKNRAVSGQELHTNFKLSASGDYIALVQPDGNTIEDEHTFGEQAEDISYGYSFSGGSATVLIDAGDSCIARVPTSASDSTNWRELSFTPSGWSSGTTGVGYETTSGYQNLIGLNVSGMHNNNASVYIRVPFAVSDASQVSQLILKMKYDDGFIAYINGTKVTESAGAPATPGWNSESIHYNDDSQAVIYEAFDISAHIGELQNGNNVLAIHGLNKPASSSDLIIVPRLEATVSNTIDTGNIGLLATPTPGSPNSSLGYAGFIDEMDASPARGFYDSSQSITLSNPTVGTTIYYTTDGSEPTTSSTAYTTPITVNSTTTLRSKAFRTDWSPSPTRSDSYIFVNDVAFQTESNGSINGQVMKYGMNAGVRNAAASSGPATVQEALKAIPTMSITTHHDNLFSPSTGIYVNASQKWERPASLELIYPDGTEGFQINFGLRIRGGYSRQSNYEKHAFRCLFKSEYGDSKLNYPLFGDEGVDRFDNIDLRTAINYNWAHENNVNNTFVRDVTARDAQGATGNEYTRSRYYHLYLNGAYWGIYMTEERPEASFAASYLGGNSEDFDIVKTQNLFDIDPYTVEATDGTLDAYNRLHAAAMAGFSSNSAYFGVQGLDTAGAVDATKERLLDVENLIDHMLIIYHYAAIDNGITQFFGDKSLNNLYAIYNRADPDGFKWILHDCEHSLDVVASNYSSKLNRTGPFNNSNFNLAKYFNPQTLHEKLSANSEYKIKFADRVYKHLQNGGALVKASSQARIDTRAAEIDHAIIANAARWGSTSRDRDTWVSAINSARSFFARSGDRATEVIGYLSADGLIPSLNPPQLSQADGLVISGTTVTLTASTGTIYYTTDGTDPRAIGGSIQGSTYSSPIVLTKPTHIKARARRSNGEWSALAEGTFWTEDIPLAITELMYHAPEGNSHDYIEIQNISNETITLKGYKLDKAIDFKFKTSAITSLAPGQIIVAVDDFDAFTTKYGTAGISIAGEFSGDFSNGGETVDFEFRNNDLITFEYNDARNWPQSADGAGHSLVPLDSAIPDQERGSLDYGGNWRASTYFEGSPGFTDPSPTNSIVLNEVIAHTDTGSAAPFDSNDSIEIYNPTDSHIILNGWYLSDSRSNPTKWAIPDGTIISAKGFLSFDEDDFHSDRIIGFGLNKAGEEVILSTSTQVVDAIRFKGQENGASYGRFPDGSDNWMLTEPTAGSANSIPTQALRISKLMFSPAVPGEDYEYIQITNISNSAFTLQNPTGSYRIDGDASFTFPTNTILAAGETLWVVSFDPNVNTTLLTLFGSTYGITPSNEAILGPYSGKLSNSAGRVAIERPQDSDDPTKPLDISWVVVDEVYYFDQSPWPVGADGTGFPLVRTGISAWGAATATDSDADQMADSWELTHFASLTQALPDWDYDGFSNFEEYTADSDPKDSSSYFKVTQITPPTLYWEAKAGRSYSVYWTSDLAQPFQKIATELTTGDYTDSTHASESANFYYIQVEID